MFRRVTIAASALVVLGALGWRLSILAESSALAQQVGQQQPAASQPIQKQPTSQPAGLPTTQPAQGKLVVQFDGSETRSGPTPEELKALVRAAEEWVKNNPKGKSVAVEKPQVKDNMCPPIPPEEREAIGLPAPTWVAKHGKVQPAVREALEAQRKLIESKAPLINFQLDRPRGFQGTVYVDIYLRHDAKGRPESQESQAAVKEAQDRILGKLTAGEFSTFFVFRKTAGLAGYVNDAGLAKVLDEVDVVAVGLDDQAQPEEPKPPLHEQSPPLARDESGRTILPPPPAMIGKVYADVYESLRESGDGYVIVEAYATLPAGWQAHPDDANATMRKIEDRIFATLTANEFKIRGRGWGFVGFINAAGLEKLSVHPDLDSVWLCERYRAIR